MVFASALPINASSMLIFSYPHHGLRFCPTGSVIGQSIYGKKKEKKKARLEPPCVIALSTMGKERKGAPCREQINKNNKACLHAYHGASIYFLSFAPSFSLSLQHSSCCPRHYSPPQLFVFFTASLLAPHYTLPTLAPVGHSNIIPSSNALFRNSLHLLHAQPIALQRACPSCFNKYRATQTWRGIAFTSNSPARILLISLLDTS